MTVLEAVDLSVHDGTQPLVSDVSLSIGPGETVLLAGPSGSGKTLLGRALGGVLADQTGLAVSGTVHRHGEVGFLFQNPRTQLVRRGVTQDIAFGLENHGVPPAEIEATIRQWARRLDATHLLGRSVEDLSRGETAVVALLGTLVVDPDLVILDEPLAPLDDRNRRVVLEILDDLQQGDTSLLVTEHDARDLLHRVDRAILLDGGEVRRRGSPRALAPSLYDAGVRLPFETSVAIERGLSDGALPLPGEEVEPA